MLGCSLFMAGAGFVVPVAGAISLMPGTGSNPAFRRVDVDTDTGRVTEFSDELFVLGLGDL